MRQWGRIGDPSPVPMALPDSRTGALLLDVDGTLYDARRLRARMAVRLAAAHALRPSALLRTARVIGAYRRAQEELRTSTGERAPSTDLATAQLDIAAQRCRVSRDEVSSIVRSGCSPK